MNIDNGSDNIPVTKKQDVRCCPKCWLFCTWIQRRHNVRRVSKGAVAQYFHISDSEFLSWMWKAKIQHFSYNGMCHYSVGTIFSIGWGEKLVQVSSLAYWASVCQICVLETKSVSYLSLLILHTGLWGVYSLKHVRLGQTNNHSHIPTSRLSWHIFILWKESAVPGKDPRRLRERLTLSKYVICW